MNATEEIPVRERNGEQNAHIEEFFKRFTETEEPVWESFGKWARAGCTRNGSQSVFSLLGSRAVSLCSKGNHQLQTRLEGFF